MWKTVELWRGICYTMMDLCCPGRRAAERERTCYEDPVSYTHLDVYKRQRQGGAGCEKRHHAQCPAQEAVSHCLSMMFSTRRSPCLYLYLIPLCF